MEDDNKKSSNAQDRTELLSCSTSVPPIPRTNSDATDYQLSSSQKIIIRGNFRTTSEVAEIMVRT